MLGVRCILGRHKCNTIANKRLVAHLEMVSFILYSQISRPIFLRSQPTLLPAVLHIDALPTTPKWDATQVELIILPR